MAHFAPARSWIAWIYFVAADGPAPMDQRATTAAPCCLPCPTKHPL
jgi:hypothetical protein